MTVKAQETTARYWRAVKTLRCKTSTPAQRLEAFEDIADIALNHVECKVGTEARRYTLRHKVVVDRSVA